MNSRLRGGSPVRSLAIVLAVAVLLGTVQAKPNHARSEGSVLEVRNDWPSAVTTDDTLDQVIAVIAARETHVGQDQQLSSMGSARTILAASTDDANDALAHALLVTGSAAEDQDRELGVAADAPSPRTVHAVPSKAVRALARQLDATLAVEHEAALAALDAVPEPLRTAVVDVVDSYAAWARSVAATASPVAPADAARGLADRARFIGAVSVLDQARRVSGVQSLSFDACPVVAIDLAGTNSWYETDCALVIDLGGQDTYRNNAGGVSGMDEACREFVEARVAALVDLGLDDDLYGDPASPRDCGSNGGAVGGMGLLIDAGGNDHYWAGSWGVNGGASNGKRTVYLPENPHQSFGLLVDAQGHDVYSASSYGANGGGSLGSGLLIDGGGDDTYTARHFGANGGGISGGAGALIDLDGDDLYEAVSLGVNGGAYAYGRGFLVDGGGDDAYSAVGGGANGGGGLGPPSVGFLLDAAGDDLYAGGTVATNGGGLGGVGTLIDVAGNDRYEADSMAVNGGALIGAGLLFDASGDDWYEAGTQATNGGAEQGLGLLFDGAGRDRYVEGASTAVLDETRAPKGTAGAQVDAPPSI